jgi:predicted trehalose synthase
MAKASSRNSKASARALADCVERPAVEPATREHLAHSATNRIEKTMMNLSDYLVDWAEQVRALADQQRDSKMQQKLVALAEECGRITMLMEPESQISRLH